MPGPDSTPKRPAPRIPASGPMRALWAAIRPERRNYVAAVVLGALASFLEVVSIGLFGVLLEVTEAGTFGRLGPFSRVLPLLAGLSPGIQRALLITMILGAIAVRGLAWWGSSTLRERVGTRVHARVRRQVFDRLAHAPLSWLQSRPIGEQDSLILHETERLGSASTGFVQLSVMSTMAVCYLGLLFYMAPVLTAAALVFLALVGWVIRRLRRPIEYHAKRMREEGKRVAGSIHETLSGLHLLKLAGRTDAAVERFDVGNRGMLEAAWKQRRALEVIAPASELFGAVVVLAILWLGLTVLPIRGNAGAIQLFPFLLTLYRFLPRFLAIPSARAQLSANLSAIPVLERFLADPAADPPPDGTEDVPAAPHRIEFRGVRFRYTPTGPAVLDGVDLAFEPGRTTALVGPSGAGKSTIVDLLLGVRHPTEGAVVVNGVDLTRLRGEPWRRCVGVVPQEPRLFDWSARDNLRLTAPDADDARILSALDAAAAGFVRALPEGLETKLGERGARLSGGERQRVCVARALLQEPAILVFDEPTSHLDAESERAVTGALVRAAKGRTAIVIAHRLSTVRAADRIVLLGGGRVVEAGSHDELMARQGAYARLVQMGRDDLSDATPPAPPVGAGGAGAAAPSRTG